MSPTMKSLGLDRLSIEERRALAEELWASLQTADKPGSFLTEEQKRELDRRIAEDDADPDGGTDWQTVHAEALKRLNQVRP